MAYGDQSEEAPQLLPGEEGRCSSCGDPISESEAEVVLHHPDFPAEPLYFHEGDGCSEPALRLAEAYPEEWSCLRRVPNADFWAGAPRYRGDAN